MKDLRGAWWAPYVTRDYLFDPDMTKNLTKAELMKIRYILELRCAFDHKIILVNAILDAQDPNNPFIMLYSEVDGYVYNPNVDFWAYIKKAKRYRR